MAAEAAKLLDELMGKYRNDDPQSKRVETKWDDRECCKYFLCGFCPSELFTNTRADLGSCEKVHDEELRKQYQASTRFERMGYEDDFVKQLNNLLSDVERRIQRGQARLALNNMQSGLGSVQSSDRDEQIEMLTTRINELVEEAEQAGCEGNVEEAQGIMKLCDQLREERSQLQDNKMIEDENAKRMEVCQVCGALLVAGDAQQRIDEHIMGKQHMGYARIRAYVEGRKQKQLKEDSDREERRKKEREEREREREKEREAIKKRNEDRERERERDRDRDRRRRRSRSRSRDRRRSRSRDRHRRSRSRDRRHRSRERRRSRSREHRSSRHSSRDKDSRRHDRSRDHSRDRSKISRTRDEETNGVEKVEALPETSEDPVEVKADTSTKSPENTAEESSSSVSQGDPSQ